MTNEQQHPGYNPFKVAFISCRQYTQLASLRLDRALSRRERIAFWLHHFACLVCRRYNRQIELIEKEAAKLAQRQNKLCAAPESAASEEFLGKLEKRVRRGDA